MFSSIYLLGYRIDGIQSLTYILGYSLVGAGTFYYLTKPKEGEEDLNKESERKLDDILSVIRLLERDIHLMEQTGILGVAKSKDNVKLLFNYRTQMLLFKIERQFLAAYTVLGPFNENNNVSVDFLKSTIENVHTKLKLELDYYLTDLNRILSDLRDLDTNTKEQIIAECDNSFNLLLDSLKDLKHNEKIDYVIQLTAILGNKLTKILLNALEEWNKIPVVI